MRDNGRGRGRREVNTQCMVGGDEWDKEEEGGKQWVHCHNRDNQTMGEEEEEGGKW